MKFEEQQIVWAKHPHHQIQWPAKVNQLLPNKCLQIAFYHSKNHYEVIVVQESECRNFNQCQINSKDSPLQLYQAYKLAKKDYAKFKQKKEVTIQQSLCATQWGAEELQKQIDNLLAHAPKNEDLERLIKGFARVKLIPNEARIYFKARLCQKLAYLVREESLLDNQLKYVLNDVRLTMKIMLIQAFKVGEL